MCSVTTAVVSKRGTSLSKSGIYLREVSKGDVSKRSICLIELSDCLREASV